VLGGRHAMDGRAVSAKLDVHRQPVLEFAVQARSWEHLTARVRHPMTMAGGEDKRLARERTVDLPAASRVAGVAHIGRRPPLAADRLAQGMLDRPTGSRESLATMGAEEGLGRRVSLHGKSLCSNDGGNRRSGPRLGTCFGQIGTSDASLDAALFATCVRRPRASLPTIAQGSRRACRPSFRR
jgi:hypothetical protein